MAIQFERVRRGDLITAGMMNKIMDTIEDLDLRVKDLETGAVDDGTVKIVELILSGPVTEFEELKIKGRNFKFSTGANRVSFDNIQVNAYKSGSNDTLLIVDIPEIPYLPENGGFVTVTVSNGISSDSSRIKVMPLPQTVYGNVAVESKSYGSTPVVEPAVITAGRDADFVYTLIAGTNITAVYDIKAEIVGQNWQNQIQILNADKDLIENKKISLTPNVPVEIFVRIHPVPRGSEGAEFSLNVGVASGDAGGDSGFDKYKVGEGAAAQDENIEIQYEETIPAGTETDSIIRLAVNHMAQVYLLAKFKEQGTHTYHVSASLISPASNWLLGFVDPIPGSGSPNIVSFDVTVPDSGNVVPMTLIIGVKPLAGATAGQVQFKVQRAGATHFTTKVLGLEVLI